MHSSVLASVSCVPYDVGQICNLKDACDQISILRIWVRWRKAKVSVKQLKIAWT